MRCGADCRLSRAARRRAHREAGGSAKDHETLQCLHKLHSCEAAYLCFPLQFWEGLVFFFPFLLTVFLSADEPLTMPTKNI